jgi:hypothetical protein
VVEANLKGYNTVSEAIDQQASLNIAKILLDKEITTVENTALFTLTDLMKTCKPSNCYLYRHKRSGQIDQGLH